MSGECVAGDLPCPSDEPCIECDEDRDACIMPDCMSNADCDDGQFCNGSERCSDCGCEPGNTPCGENESCNEETDQCEMLLLSLICSIEPSDPCLEFPGGSTNILTSIVENARGNLTYMWTASQGTFDDSSLPNPQLTLGGSALGYVTVELQVIDTFVSGMTSTIAMASCEQTLSISGSSLPINAGADRILFPAAVDFGGSVPFSQGAYLASGQGGAVPAIRVIVDRGRDPGPRFHWEIVRVPARARIEDVSLANSDTDVMTYWIAPNPEASVPTITRSGHSVPVSNIVVPGRYTFRITVSYPDFGCGSRVLIDEVSHTLIPPFDIVTDGP